MASEWRANLDGDEFSAVGCVDVRDTGGVVDGCGVARGCFVSVVFSTERVTVVG